MYQINTKLIFDRIQSLNYTSTQLAEELNTTSSKLSRIINNKQQYIDLEFLYNMGKLLNLKLDEMIVDDDIEEKDICDTLDNIIDSTFLLNVIDLNKKLQDQVNKYVQRKSMINNFYTNAMKGNKSSEYIHRNDSGQYEILLHKLKLKNNSKIKDAVAEVAAAYSCEHEEEIEE